MRGLAGFLDPPLSRDLHLLAPFGRSPAQPGPGQGIACIEGEPAAGCQMPAGVPQYRHRRSIAQQGLEGVACHVDEAEALGALQLLPRRVDPGHPRRAGPAAGDGKHARRRIGAHHLESFRRQARSREPCAAAKIEHRPAGLPGQSEIEFVVRSPGIEMVVEPGDGLVGIEVGGLSHGRPAGAGRRWRGRRGHRPGARRG